MDADLIVVGAGPSGAATARLCALAGLETLVLDRALFPREKPCAGGLSPRAVADLGRVFGPARSGEPAVCSWACGVPRFTVRAHLHSRPGGRRGQGRYRRLHFRLPGPVVHVCRRRVLDHHLLARAEAAGARVLTGVEALSWGQDEDGVWVVVRGPGPVPVRTLEARFLVGADGAASVVARGLGTRGRAADGRRLRPRRRPATLCLSVFVPLDREDAERATRGAVDLHFGLVRGGWGWVLPGPTGLAAGVGMLVGAWSPAGGEGRPAGGEGRTRGRLEEALARMLHLYGLEPGHPDTSPPRLWPVPVAGAAGTRGAGRVLLVGDAAGVADPLTGRGIGPAVRSAEVAARAVVRWTEGERRPAGREGAKADRPRADQALRWRRAFAAALGVWGDPLPRQVGGPGDEYSSRLWAQEQAGQRWRLRAVRTAFGLPPERHGMLFRRPVLAGLVAEMLCGRQAPHRHGAPGSQKTE